MAWGCCGIDAQVARYKKCVCFTHQQCVFAAAAAVAAMHALLALIAVFALLRPASAAVHCTSCNVLQSNK
jgi:hypothetical protein